MANDEFCREYISQLLKLTQESSKLHAKIEQGYKTRIRARIGRVEFGYRISGRRGIVELVIESYKKKENKEMFDQLKAKKDEIESAFGCILEWDRSNDKQSCRITKTYSSGGYLEKKEHWPSIQNEMIDAMSRLHKAFLPHIEELKRT